MKFFTEIDWNEWLTPVILYGRRTAYSYTELSFRVGPFTVGVVWLP